MWCSHRDSQTYDRVDFDPSVNGPVGNVFNLFSGFQIPYPPPEWGPENIQSISHFLDHCYTILCDGDEEKYTYMINWLAHLYQNPGEKMRVALVLFGPQGSGKGRTLVLSYNTLLYSNAHIKTRRFDTLHHHTLGILYKVMQSVLGSHYCQQFVSLDGLNEQFQSDTAMTNLLTYFDEFHRGSIKEESRMKFAITEGSRRINQKHLNVKDTVSRSNFIIASNLSDSVKLERLDRRYHVFNVST